MPKESLQFKTELKEIDAIANYSDLAAYFGKANKNGVSIPFSVAVTEDFKDPKKYTLNDLARRIRFARA